MWDLSSATADRIQAPCIAKRILNHWTTGESESESHSVVSDSLWPHGLYRSWNSPGQNTGVGGLSLLQGIVPNQGWNPGLLHCRWILCQVNHQESPRILAWVAYPFSRGSSGPRNRTRVSCTAGGFLTSWGSRESTEMAGEVTVFVCVACFCVLAWGWLCDIVAFTFSFLFLGARAHFENLFWISIIHWALFIFYGFLGSAFLYLPGMSKFLVCCVYMYTYIQFLCCV